MKKSKSKSKPVGQIDAIADGKIGRNDAVILVGYDCITGLPIVRKWERNARLY